MDGAGEGLQGGDQGLFEELRTLRREVARREGLPAYMIFNDATLREMATLRPRDAAALLDINGVGEKKLAKFGEEFLTLLQR